MNTIFRRLTKSDEQVLREFSQKIERGPHFNWTSEEIQTGLLKWDLWGGFAQDELVVALAARSLGDEVELLWVQTLSQRRGQRWASQLMDAWLSNAKHNHSRAFLEVHERNKSALQLYTHLGFQPVGERKNYYKDGASALVLSLKLPS